MFEVFAHMIRDDDSSLFELVFENVANERNTATAAGSSLCRRFQIWERLARACVDGVTNHALHDVLARTDRGGIAHRTDPDRGDAADIRDDQRLWVLGSRHI